MKGCSGVPRTSKRVVSSVIESIPPTCSAYDSRYSQTRPGSSEKTKSAASVDSRATGGF
jgi:hypothetical protein